MNRQIYHYHVFNAAQITEEVLDQLPSLPTTNLVRLYQEGDQLGSRYICSAVPEGSVILLTTTLGTYHDRSLKKFIDILIHAKLGVLVYRGVGYKASRTNQQLLRTVDPYSPVEPLTLNINSVKVSNRIRLHPNPKNPDQIIPDERLYNLANYQLVYNETLAPTTVRFIMKIKHTDTSYSFTHLTEYSGVVMVRNESDTLLNLFLQPRPRHDQRTSSPQTRYRAPSRGNPQTYRRKNERK